jgi:ABC-type nitrate/sulfonate/bicarbonate transport system substrate-binding protein
MRARTMPGIAYAAFLLAGIYGCGGLAPVHRRAADEIRLGVLSISVDHWPRWVAWDQGFFKEENLEVREFQTDSIAESIRTLAANSTDLLFPANTDGVIVAMSKGATMGVINLTSGSTVLLQKILLAHGLKYPGDYDLLTLGGTPSRYAAVRKGAVAAPMVTIPTSYEAIEDGLNILAGISDYLPDWQFTVLAGNTNWMASHKDQTVRFTMAMIKAMRFLNDPNNKEASIQSMVKHFHVRRKYAELAYEEVIQQLHAVQNDGAPSFRGMETAVNFDVDNKVLDKTYPPSQFIDDSYRLEALQRLGG